MFNQKLLLSAEYLFDLKPLKNYRLLFSPIDSFQFPYTNAPTGRPLIPRQSLLKALIFKNLRGLSNLSDLVSELSDNPSLSLLCGFDPQKPLPTTETFSAFLKDSPNKFFQSVREYLLFELVKINQIKAKYLSVDSCPIKANVKENNLKATVSDRFNKHRPPKGDPDARVGVIVTYPKSNKPKIEYFWGYRNFVVSDALTELPVAEITKPANLHDSQCFIPLFSFIKDHLHILPKGVIADSAFDSQAILRFIIDELKAKPYIFRNPAHKQSAFPLSSKGNRICIAGLEMLPWGKFKDHNRNSVRLKFVCPILNSKKFAKHISVCPVMHPSFMNSKGCTAYLRLDEDIRDSINYDSPHFKKIYNLRTGSERIFSRLLSICMQNPSIKGLNTTANHVTIAHITALLVALTAVKTNNKNKIRFIKSLVKEL